MRVKSGLLGLLILLAMSGATARAQEPNRCPEVENIPGNLVYNCSFERDWVGIELGQIG